jgi:DNA invertase Pin-like site-specific DNA recombinase/biotin operon repressor
MNAKQRLEQIYREFNERIDELYAEYIAKFLRNDETVEGSLYARQSTPEQGSIPDQIRAMLQEALQKNIFIRRERIFFDAGVTGRSSRRVGIDQIEALMLQRLIAVALFFTTSRLFRKMYLLLKFVEVYTKQYGIRLIFVSSKLDTSAPEADKLLAMLSMIDQFTGTAHIANIQAAHIGLFLQGYLVGKLNYGYQGLEVEGQMTRRGRKRRRLAIHPEEAARVIIIFEKFLYEFRCKRALVRWLNDESDFPPPENSQTGEWTITIVETILSYEGYIGRFFYGEEESVFLSEKNYNLKKPRVEPLATRQDETLRILSDKVFQDVQKLLLNHRRGGRRIRPGKLALPRLLNGRIVCHKHKLPLHCTGQSGGVMNCRKCVALPAKKRAIYSYLPRQHATNKVIEAVISAIELFAPQLVLETVKQCQQFVAGLQAVDPARRHHLEEKIAKLESSIEKTFQDPGESLEDKAGAKKSRDKFRAAAAVLRAELAELDSIEAQPKRIPTVSDVKRKLKELNDDLRRAINSHDRTKVGVAIKLLDCVLGDKILLYQRGEPRSHRGWLEGRCPFRLKVFLLQQYGIAVDASGIAEELVIDFRRPRRRESLKQKILELYEAGQTLEEIATQLKIGNSTVERYIDEIHREAGKPKPTKKERRKLISGRDDKLPYYKQIAAAVLEMLQHGVLRGEIAESLNTNTTTLEKTVEFLREQGHDIPDGRSTNSGRKSHQPPQPPEEQGDDEEGPKAG